MEMKQRQTTLFECFHGPVPEDRAASEHTATANVDLAETTERGPDVTPGERGVEAVIPTAID